MNCAADAHIKMSFQQFTAMVRQKAKQQGIEINPKNHKKEKL
jgi:hypothetical protein